MSLSITPVGSLAAFRPGDTVEAVARWILPIIPKTFEARLFWFTRGKGSEDVSVVETIAFHPTREGERTVRFRLPEAPYSFSGVLITLTWAIEIVADDDAARWEFVVGPDSAEVRLGGEVSLARS